MQQVPIPALRMSGPRSPAGQTTGGDSSFELGGSSSVSRLRKPPRLFLVATKDLSPGSQTLVSALARQQFRRSPFFRRSLRPSGLNTKMATSPASATYSHTSGDFSNTRDPSSEASVAYTEGTVESVDSEALVTKKDDGHLGNSKTSFSDFPAEVRNMIYRLLITDIDSRSLHRAYRRELESYFHRKLAGSSEPLPAYKQRLHTPTILLLCRWITHECQPLLDDRKLVIDQLGPWLPGASNPMFPSQFVGRRTLQRMKHFEVRMSLGEGSLGSGWVWSKILFDLIAVLIQANSFVRLKIMIRKFNVRDYGIWREEQGYENDIMENIELIREKNPCIWKPGVVETEVWHVEEDVATKVVNPSDKPERRYPPDPVIWSGGILQFLARF